MKARVVVIGGGIMGVSAALHLAKRLDPLSEPVLLIEKQDLGSGSSGRSGAILRQHYSYRELAGMARDSLRIYSGMLRTTGRSVGFLRTGVLTIAGPERPEDLELVRRNVQMQIEIGIHTELVDATRMRELVRGIELDDRSLGAWEPDAGAVDPRQAVETFAALAKSHGATIRAGKPVTRIAVEKGAVQGVEVDGELIETSNVVLATGPWSGSLLNELGIELPLKVIRPEQHFVQMPSMSIENEKPEGPHGEHEEEIDERFHSPEAEVPVAAHPVLLDLENLSYARCENDGLRTRVGGMDLSDDLEVADPDALDETVSSEFQSWARETLVKRMPTYAELDDVDSMIGIYTMTPDCQAVIGELPELEGMFVVTGFSGHGFKLAPSVGEGVAQLVLGEPVSAFDPSFFEPGRFTSRPVEAGRGFGL